MKTLFALSLLTLSAVASANSVIANGTRFIYPSNQKEITVQLTNKANRPALIQTWLDNGNAEESPETIVTPFTITPPISRVEGNQGQTLRIRGINTAGIPTDRESLWYLNVLEVPPTEVGAENDNGSKLKTAIRSRFKFFYRPVGLKDRASAGEKLVLKASGKKLIVDNPTPFYITVSSVVKGNTAVNSGATMIAPKSSATIPLKTSVAPKEKLSIANINDYGSEVKTVLITQ